MSFLPRARRRLVGLLLAAALIAPGISIPAGAQEGDAFVDASLEALTRLLATCREHDAVDGDTGNGAELPYRFCDDGPADPVSGDAGIPVPGKYHETDGDDYTGLPAPGTADEVAEAESQDDIRAEAGNRVTIDVDISLPPVTMTPPPEGFPIIAMNHGFA
ncbi:MAG TPA: hypothetical protein VHJ82_02990, partial [Actinomycetota bacterium]|nr:hypothetical protein [Actinomycetota bacterium]